MIKSNKACPLIKYKENPECIHNSTKGYEEYIMDHQIITVKEHIKAMPQYHI